MSNVGCQKSLCHCISVFETPFTIYVRLFWSLQLAPRAFRRYRDTQRITIQEMPERAPTGLLPRAIEVPPEGQFVSTA